MNAANTDKDLKPSAKRRAPSWQTPAIHLAKRLWRQGLAPKPSISLALTFIATLAWIAPGLGKAELIENIVAIVQDDVILQSELDERVKIASLEYEAYKLDAPSSLELQKLSLDQLILESVHMQFANRSGIRVSDDELLAAMNQIARQNGVGLEAFKRRLSTQGFTYTQVRDRIRRDIVMQRVQSGAARSKIEISPDEVRRFISSDSGKQAVEYLASQLLVKVNDPDDQQEVRSAIERANQIRAQLVTSPSPGEAIDSWASASGTVQASSLGWRRHGGLPRLFADKLEAMEIGETSDLVQSGAGVHILVLRDKRGDAVRIQDQVRAKQIVLSANEIRGAAETADLAATTYRQLRADPALFASLARQISDDPKSRYRGGDTGWFAPSDSEIPNALRRTYLEAPTGALNPPLEIGASWYIVQVDAKRQADLSGEALEDYAFRAIFQRKFEEVKPQIIRELKASAYIEIVDPELRVLQEAGRAN